MIMPILPEADAFSEHYSENYQAHPKLASIDYFP